MYNEQIESLITAALADGVLTEKEKQILFKKVGRTDAHGRLWHGNKNVNPTYFYITNIMPRQAQKTALPGLYFVKIFSQKSPSRKVGPCELTEVKYRSRYSFPAVFRPQKSQLKTQNS